MISRSLFRKLIALHNMYSLVSMRAQPPSNSFPALSGTTIYKSCANQQLRLKSNSEWSALRDRLTLGITPPNAAARCWLIPRNSRRTFRHAGQCQKNRYALHLRLAPAGLWCGGPVQPDFRTRARGRGQKRRAWWSFVARTRGDQTACGKGHLRIIKLAAKPYEKTNFKDPHSVDASRPIRASYLGFGQSCGPATRLCSLAVHLCCCIGSRHSTFCCASASCTGSLISIRNV